MIRDIPLMDAVAKPIHCGPVSKGSEGVAQLHTRQQEAKMDDSRQLVGRISYLYASCTKKAYRCEHACIYGKSVINPIALEGVE